MNNITKYAVAAALAAIIARMTYFLLLAPDEEWDMYVRFAYLLLFLLALFLGLRAEKIDQPQSSFTTDIKTGMKITSIFAIIISSFTFLYYKWINPAFFADKIQNVIDNASGDQAENAQRWAELIFSPFSHSTLTLLGVIVIGFFYTIILIMIMRRKPEILIN